MRRLRLGISTCALFLAGSVAGGLPFWISLGARGALDDFLRISFFEIPRWVTPAWGLPAPSFSKALFPIRDFPAFSPPFQPDGRPSMEKAAEVIETASGTGYHRFDWLHQTRGGDPRPCEIALTRISLGGQPHIFATMTDLRDRKREPPGRGRASPELAGGHTGANAAFPRPRRVPSCRGDSRILL